MVEGKVNIVSQL